VAVMEATINMPKYSYDIIINLYFAMGDFFTASGKYAQSPDEFPILPTIQGVI